MVIYIWFTDFNFFGVMVHNSSYTSFILNVCDDHHVDFEMKSSSCKETEYYVVKVIIYTWVVFYVYIYTVFMMFLQVLSFFVSSVLDLY